MNISGFQRWRRMAVAGLGLVLALAFTSGCSVKKFAVNEVGNALAGSGTSYSSDEDPELVRDALPFSLKLMESLLAESPNHRGLLLASCRGFTVYAYGFLQEEADETEPRDLAAATALNVRTRKMYLRARNYGLRGLAVYHPGFEQALRANPKQAVSVATKADVPLLYWTAAAWGAAISHSKNTPDLVADRGILEALIDRAFVLDPDYDHGALDVFLISYEMARPGVTQDVAVAQARKHFDRALALSEGKLAGPLVVFAEQVCVQKQQKQEFQELLKRALAINVNDQPETRLENLLMQRRARWLLSRTDELFLE